jgi:hypothetical protein
MPVKEGATGKPLEREREGEGGRERGRKKYFKARIRRERSQ